MVRYLTKNQFNTVLSFKSLKIIILPLFLSSALVFSYHSVSNAETPQSMETTTEILKQATQMLADYQWDSTMPEINAYFATNNKDEEEAILVKLKDKYCAQAKNFCEQSVDEIEKNRATIFNMREKVKSTKERSQDEKMRSKIKSTSNNLGVLNLVLSEAVISVQDKNLAEIKSRGAELNKELIFKYNLYLNQVEKEQLGVKKFLNDLVDFEKAPEPLKQRARALLANKNIKWED